MTDIAFTKMHGLGNDFVIIDIRDSSLKITAEQARAIANRHTGIGCDQLILLEPIADHHPPLAADIFMRIFNADGSEVEACGNATRCVAEMIILEHSFTKVKIATVAGTLEAEKLPNGLIAVDMGEPNFNWEEIPLATAADTLYLNIQAGELSNPSAVNIGNPHCIFFVEDASKVALQQLGKNLEQHHLFPERANISVAEVKNNQSIYLRVWERGVGITNACGTAACAAAVAAHRRSLTERDVLVQLEGGSLNITWKTDNHVVLIGPTETSFQGSFNSKLIRGV